MAGRTLADERSQATGAPLTPHRGARLRPLGLAGLLLCGCSWISEADREERMDLDGDGVPRPTDCDDDDPSLGGPGSWFVDTDGDGFGGSTASDACQWSEGLVADSSDCDDTDALVFPGAEERCNEQDDDCDEQADEGVELHSWYRDVDGDGHGDASFSQQACYAPEGYVEAGDDCDDLNADVNPSTAEVCDPYDLDEDCDGLADDEDDSASGQVTVYQDQDGDGFGVDEVTSAACDAGGGWALQPEDCDDEDATRHPDVSWYRDADEDGYGDGDNSIRSCEDVAGYVLDGTDCDDAQAAHNPGAQEVCDPLDEDEDCDGLADDADDSAGGLLPFYLDTDGDGYGEDSSVTMACDPWSAWVALGRDCDEGDTAINPGVLETCDDGIDQDCDEDIDCQDVNCSREDACGSYDLGEVDTSFEGAEVEYLGRSMDAAGDFDGDGQGDLVLGAYPHGDAGAAYVLFGPFSGSQRVDAMPRATLLGIENGDSAGYSVAGLGDVDADGYDDVLVGAIWAGEGGGAFLVRGPVSGVVSLALADARIYHSTHSASFGSLSSGGGDLDADAQNDLVVAAPQVESVHLYSGSATGPLSESDARITLTATDNAEPSSLCAGGDVNADGQADLAVGMSTYEGQAFLAYGPLSADGSLGVHLGAYVSGFRDYESCAVSVSCSGDVDGDGYDDLLAGAYYASCGGSFEGCSHLFYGPLTGEHDASDAAATLQGTEDEEYTGYAVDLPGDLNGDGFGDLVVGAPYSAAGLATAGGAYIVFGPVSGELSLEDADARLHGEADGDEAGRAVEGVGDLDGDGRQDLLIGAPKNDGSESSTGAAYLIYGLNL